MTSGEFKFRAKQRYSVDWAEFWDATHNFDIVMLL